MFGLTNHLATSHLLKTNNSFLLASFIELGFLSHYCGGEAWGLFFRQFQGWTIIYRYSVNMN